MKVQIEIFLPDSELKYAQDKGTICLVMYIQLSFAREIR